MTWGNTRTHWGWAVILGHWLSVIIIIGMIALGLWMVDLTYYDSWYRQAPHIHKSIGFLLFALTLLRIFWRLINPRPLPLDSHCKLEKNLAQAIQGLLYILLLAIMFSGYLISTADGRSIEVFNWFEIPALFPGFDQQEDIAGDSHFWLVMGLIMVVLIHSLGAIKHHVIDRDNTLKRMFGK